MRLVTDADVRGKRVLLRVDFNVPLADGTVTDDKRIRASLPTINWLLDNGARLVIASHVGRPKGVGYEEAYSMLPCARVLGRLLARPIELAADVSGEKVKAQSLSLADGEVLMLENLRFDSREKKNDSSFAGELAQLCDIYVNDAFGVSHREHASIAAITKLVPSYAGLLLDREVKTLTSMLSEPTRPFVAVLGGSKVSDKIQAITSLLDVADVLLIGGAMCFTFLQALGYNTGNSLVEKDWVDAAGKMLEAAKEKSVALVLPDDIVAAERISNDIPTSVCNVAEIPKDLMGLDIGPLTSSNYARHIASAATVFWNGPMGVFEIKPFASGTEKIANAIANNTNAVTVVGGGDSAAAIHLFNLADRVSFVSTGGGASMQMIEGIPLPGVLALENHCL